ncbi:MAG TPA: helix-turn-helix transcriptional regulator [Kribbella sp.]|jgi:DNA-binding CsgD family transcriptional regulator
MKLSHREQAICALLAAGHTDASTAGLLGISSRTIAYTLRALMDRVGVQNRFQLGLVLGAFEADRLTAGDLTDARADQEDDGPAV